MVISTDIKPAGAPPQAEDLTADFRRMTDYNRHLDHRANTRLSPRERQVLELAGRGLTAPAIARHLQLQPRTIDLHYWKIKIKLGLRSPGELATYAQRWVSIAADLDTALADHSHKLGGDPSERASGL